MRFRSRHLCARNLPKWWRKWLKVASEVFPLMSAFFLTHSEDSNDCVAILLLMNSHCEFCLVSFLIFRLKLSAHFEPSSWYSKIMQKEIFIDSDKIIKF
jgi:hypothetical protein